MNVLLSLPHLYTKFYGQIHLTLKVTKKTNFLTTIIVQMHLKFVFFVTSRVRSDSYCFFLKKIRQGLDSQMSIVLQIVQS